MYLTVTVKSSQGCHHYGLLGFVTHDLYSHGKRLQKTALGSQKWLLEPFSKVRLHGSVETGQKQLLASKRGLGSHLKGEAVCSQKRHTIGSPASETSSGAAARSHFLLIFLLSDQGFHCHLLITFYPLYQTVEFTCSIFMIDIGKS